MKVYRGILRQRGYGFGALLKLGIPLLGGIGGELLGGVIKKKFQKGKGLGNTIAGVYHRGKEKLKGMVRGKALDLYHRGMRAASGRVPHQSAVQALGNTAMDLIDGKRSLAQGLRHYGTHALKQVGNNLVEQQMRQNLPILKAPLIGSILNKTMMPLVRRKVDSANKGAVQKVLGQRGKGMLSNIMKIGAKGMAPLMKRQLQKGAKQLAVAGAQQAIQSAAQAGADILKGKTAKQALQQRTSQAVKRTYDQMAGPILAKSGPKKKKKRKDIFD